MRHESFRLCVCCLFVAVVSCRLDTAVELSSEHFTTRRLVVDSLEFI